MDKDTSSLMTVACGHLIADFFSRGGFLTVSKTDITFKPHILDKMLLAKEVVISISSITELKITNGPCNLTDDIHIYLKNGERYKFRMKDAGQFICCLKKKYSNVLVSEYFRTPVKKTVLSYYEENITRIAKDLIAWCLIVTPMFVYGYLVIYYMQESRTDNMLNVESILSLMGGSQKSIMLAAVVCQLVSVPIIIYKIYISTYSRSAKYMMYAIVLLLWPVAVPVVYGYFLKEDICKWR